MYILYSSLEKKEIKSKKKKIIRTDFHATANIFFLQTIVHSPSQSKI